MTDPQAPAPTDRTERTEWTEDEAGAVASLLEVADARLLEISHLAARLGEVSGQAQVAALNVSLEIVRDGGARAETEAAFAEEVRRLAERVEAAARRLPGLVERLEAAHREARARLGLPGAPAQGQAPAGTEGGA